MDQYTITIHPAGDVDVNRWPDAGLTPHLYEQIGCSIVTPVELGAHLTLWCDDEGLLAATPEINPLATKLCGAYGPLGSYLVGTVVLTGPADQTGETLPLGPGAVAVLGGVFAVLNDQPLPRLVD